MTTAHGDTYTVPDDPDDPETAALELIVRLPSCLSQRLAAATAAAGLTEVLQDYCTVLDAEGCFAGMSWHDAKAAAAAICFDICNRDDPAEFLRHRAQLTREGQDGQTWDDRDAMARAFTIGAQVLGL